ncbi:hypothetical protein PC123_g12344 [Phytophthora cactorum]|nr:hypothetical protein PC123_g12344 [Phytophthora cactorum]
MRQAQEAAASITNDKDDNVEATEAIGAVSDVRVEPLDRDPARSRRFGAEQEGVTASPSIRNQSEKSGVGPPRAGTTPIITRSPGPPQRTPPALLQDVYLDKLVAFPPEKELWMKSKHYRPVGTAFMVGRVCRRPLRGKFASLFEIRWLDSQFQLAVEHVSIGLVQCAVENYALLTRQKSDPDWQELVKKMLTIN